MNPLSSYWLDKRQEKARRMIRGSSILDVGSRSEKICADAVALDINRSVRPDICATAEYLPLKDKSFDYITMLEVIEHLDLAQSDRALEECKRVATKLVLSTPNCDSKLWNGIVWPLWNHTVGREWMNAHKQFFGRRSIEELLVQRHDMTILERDFSRWNLLLLASTAPQT